MPRASNRLVTLLLFLLAARAWAGPTEESKTHYDRAVALYQYEHYEEALREFQAAYDLRQKPILLYNMAHCHRHLGHAKEALEYYQRYHDLEPNLGEDQKAKVQGYIGQMRSLLEQKSTAGPAEPKPPPPPPAAAHGPVPSPIHVPKGAAQPSRRPAASGQRQRLALRVSKWALAGAGLAAVIAGATLWGLDGYQTCAKAAIGHCELELDGKTPGIPLLAGGLAILGASGVLFGIDYRRQHAGMHTATLALSGAF